MRSALMVTMLALGTTLVPGTASAAEGFVVWLQPDTPEEKKLQKVENLTNANVHLAHVDLAFPPQPATPEDAARIETLRETMADGKARWDEFDVELTIARELEAAIVPVDLIRDNRDLQDVVDARLFQGAAIQKAFSPDDFANNDDAAAFRRELPGVTANAPWVLAFALDPDREITRADVADGSAFPDMQALQPAYRELLSAELDVSKVPTGATLVVDGAEAKPEDDVIKLRPGVHYTHVLRRGQVSGRQLLDVKSSQKLDLPLIVDDTELEQARLQVLQGLTTGFPDDVKSSIEDLSEHNDGPIFVAALDDKGRVTVLPYARGATLLKSKPVSFVFAGEVGGGLIVSELFDEDAEKSVTAPAIMGHLGFEFGIYNFAIVGGSDISLTPTGPVYFGDDKKTSIMPQPWGGLGLYVLRPTGNTPTMLLAGTYGFNYPGHRAVGGRMAFGVPIDENKTWFRIVLGGDASGSSTLDSPRDGAQMYRMYLRFGLAGGL
ncbi:MAG: hypothetical protein AB8H79_18570 [Myxococcota bacterium]